jgi:predicted dehydrogenase
MNKISRRDFIKRTTATAALCAMPCLVPSSVLGVNAPSNRLNVGSIGVGNMGFTNLNGFLHKDQCRVVAVCDVNAAGYYKTATQFRGREPAIELVNKRYARQKRSGQYKGCDGYVDFREVIARDDIDVVCVTTPDHWHAIPVIMAARAGKHIYCEKPLSLTIAEGRTMVDAVKRYGITLQMGTMHRSQKLNRFACELVRNGRIGKLKRIVVVLGRHGLRKDVDNWQPMPVPKGFDYDMWLGPAPRVPYHKDRCFYTFRFGEDYSGGETTNTGAHCFDIAQWGNNTEYTGPIEIEDLGSEWPTDGLHSTVTKIHFRARFANGVELLTTPQGKRGFLATFEGTEGWVSTSSRRIETYPESLKTSVIGPNEIHLYKSDDHKQDFLDCIRTRRDPITPVEVGHRSATICHLANIAMKLHRKLRWDPDNERFIGDDQANRMLSKPMRAPWHL